MVNNAVAALGTALSNQQITQLCRVSDSKRIVLNFDADGAGIRAANRAIGEVEQLALQGQLELRVLHLPSGKDPDEFLKDNGAGDYRALLDQAPLWLDWQIEQVLEGRDLAKADQFQQGVSALVALLGKLPPSAIRTRLRRLFELGCSSTSERRRSRARARSRTQAAFAAPRSGASRTATRSASSALVTARTDGWVPSLCMSQCSKCSMGPAFIVINGGWIMGPAFINAPDNASSQGSMAG